jgi:hypothetical protein
MVVRIRLPRSVPDLALGGHQPLHRAPSHLVALCAQMQPHFAGTEPDPEPVLTCGPDQLEDLGVAQRTPRRRPGARLAVGRRSDLDAVLGQHPTDRLDSVQISMLVDELDQYLGGRASSAAENAEADFRI